MKINNNKKLRYIKESLAFFNDNDTSGHRFGCDCPVCMAKNQDLSQEESPVVEDEKEVEDSLENQTEIPKEPEASTDTFTATSYSKPEWCIAKFMTDNGIRIGIDCMSECDCDIIKDNLSYTEAVDCIDSIAQECDVELYDSEKDVFIGKISPVVVKREKKSTSYKY